MSGRTVLALACAAAIASGCGRPREPEPRPDAITDFATLYAANCAACHGIDGRHGVAQPLNDPAYLAFVDEPRLREVITRGVPATPMAAFGRDAGGSLTAEQVNAIAAGLKRTWGGTPAPTSMPAYSGEEANARGSAPGDARRGARAFAAYCAHCHGEDGRGGPTVGSLVDRAYLALTSDQALRTAVVIGRDDEGTRDRRDDAARRAMSDQEIADIVAWIASHRAAE